MAMTLLLLALAIALIWLFNRWVRMRNQVRVAWSDVDVQLQRRHDLVPALVASVKGYAGHESALLTRVAAERRQAQSSPSPAARSEPETALGQDLGRLLAVAEAWPDLKASANFQQLSRELVAVEDAISHARRFYNGSVRQYNTALERFPAVLVARPLGFTQAEFFAAGDDARATVAVALD
ncbi:MAG TPA: LemA family protein [Rhodanobacteraceae bacterium]|nr:LemA family protein [Rhodanobacteraceae bacterium]